MLHRLFKRTHLVTLRSRRQPGRDRFQQGTLKVAHSGSNRRGCLHHLFPAVTMATSGPNPRAERKYKSSQSDSADRLPLSQSQPASTVASTVTVASTLSTVASTVYGCKYGLRLQVARAAETCYPFCARDALGDLWAGDKLSDIVTLWPRRQPGRVRFQQGTLKVAHSGSNRRGYYSIFSPK